MLTTTLLLTLPDDKRRGILEELNAEEERRLNREHLATRARTFIDNIKYFLENPDDPIRHTPSDSWLHVKNENNQHVIFGTFLGKPILFARISVLDPEFSEKLDDIVPKAVTLAAALEDPATLPSALPSHHFQRQIRIGGYNHFRFRRPENI